jgi:hypothetical protein
MIDLGKAIYLLITNGRLISFTCSNCCYDQLCFDRSTIPNNREMAAVVDAKWLIKGVVDETR